MAALVSCCSGKETFLTGNPALVGTWRVTPTTCSALSLRGCSSIARLPAKCMKSFSIQLQVAGLSFLKPQA